MIVHIIRTKIHIFIVITLILTNIEKNFNNVLNELWNNKIKEKLTKFN